MNESIVESTATEIGPNWKFDAEISAYFRTLYQRLRGCSDRGAAPSVVGVTGCGRGEGVSLVASRLAIAAAEDCQQKVLLVDANPTTFSVQRSLTVDTLPGLLDVVRGSHRLDEVLQPTSVNNLSVLPPGTAPSEFAATNTSTMVHELIRSLSASFSFIVVDMAPADQLGDDVGVMTAVDGVVLVVEADTTKRSRARAATAALSRVRLLGAVLNKPADPR